MKRNEQVISTQVSRIKDVLSKLISPGTRYALLDFPDHSNVGDSAIWLGEINLLSQLTGNLPSYVCKFDRFDADQMLKFHPSGPIFLHGGGNFGDIWPCYQEFREMIIDRFKDRTIIQLPQTTSFSEKQAIDRSARVIARHPNFHLLVRDQTSFEFSKNNFQCPIELVPDMAFGMGPLKRTHEPVHQVYMLLREDSERADYDRTLLHSVPKSVSADWLEERPYFDKQSKSIAALKALFSGAWSRDQLRIIYYQQLATGRLNRGLKMLSSGQQVITDRLHAHILSTLLDIPHVALDNNYGKISSYISAWTNSYPALLSAKTSEEALEKLVLLPIN